MPKAWSPVMRWPSREWALKISQYFPMSASEMGLLAMVWGGGLCGVAVVESLEGGISGGSGGWRLLSSAEGEASSTGNNAEPLRWDAFDKCTNESCFCSCSRKYLINSYWMVEYLYPRKQFISMTGMQLSHAYKAFGP